MKVSLPRKWLQPTSFWLLCGATLASLVMIGCRVTDLPLWGTKTEPCDCAVEKISGISYSGATGAEGFRNQLDLFIPKGKKECPVVVLVHGGAWMIGDNRCCGLYSSVGEYLASQGIIAVLPNYRLSPEIKHPAHIQDVARAVAWVHNHIGEFGGQQKQLFLMGHSAGGHLVSLLVTDEQYLRAEGLGTKDIQGVIAVSGPYRIAPGNMEITLGGQTSNAIRWDKVVPLRDDNSPSKLPLPGIPLSLDIFGLAFGPNATDRAAASPLTHVRPGLPPFLLFYADNDLPSLPELAKEFHQALVEQGCNSHLHEIPQRNHNSIIFQAYQANDPVARAVVEFVTGAGEK